MFAKVVQEELLVRRHLRIIRDIGFYAYGSSERLLFGVPVYCHSYLAPLPAPLDLEGNPRHRGSDFSQHSHPAVYPHEFIGPRLSPPRTVHHPALSAPAGDEFLERPLWS